MSRPTLRQRIAAASPFVALWRRERRAHAVTRSDLEAHAVHFALACDQRDRALDEARTATAAAMAAEARCRRLDKQLDLLVRDAIAAWEAEA